jgi:CHAT domain-containing protein/tetratricopeptide (TPR) repeat protein
MKASIGLFLTLVVATLGTAVAAEKAVDPAATTMREAAELERAGRWPAALELYERVLQEREEALGPDHPLVADTLVRYAMLLRKDHDFFGFGARPLLQRAESIDEESLSSGGRVLLRILEGRIEEAEAEARDLVTRVEARHGSESVETARALDHLVETIWRGGSDPDPRALAERAIEIKARILGREHTATAWSLCNLGLLVGGGVYGRAGTSEERELYTEAMEIWERTLGPDHWLVAGMLWNLYLVSRDHMERVALLERSAEIMVRGYGIDDPFTVEIVAELTHLRGDRIGNRQAWARHLAVLEGKPGTSDAVLAYTIHELADAHAALGEYKEAEALFRRAIALREKIGGPVDLDLAMSLNNLANVLGSRSAEKIALYERAAGIWESRLGPDAPLVGAVLGNLAGTYIARGDLAKARELFERAVAIEKKSGSADRTWFPSDAYGNLLWGTGEYEKALSVLEQSLETKIRTLGPEHPATAGGMLAVARVAVALNDRSRAFDLALRAEEISRENLRLNARRLSERQALSYGSRRSKGLGLALFLMDDETSAESRNRAWDALVRSRAVVLDEMALRHRVVAEVDDPEVRQLADRLEQAATRLANLLVRGSGGESPELHRALVTQARREREAAEEALASKSASFARGLDASNRGLGEVRRTLPDGVALVAFARTGGPRYRAFVATDRDDAPITISLGPTQEIDELVSKWHEEAAVGAWASDRSGGEAEAAYRAAGEMLRKKIWDPWASRLGNARQVLVIPDGPLHLVNFAALPDGEERYLIESAPTVHYLSAERDVAAPREVKSKGMLALGSPSFDATALFAALAPERGAPAEEGEEEILIASARVFRGASSSCADFQSLRFRELPETETEIEQVVSLWKARGGSAETEEPTGAGSVLPLTGPAASETAFKRLASGHRILHLATHGFFLGKRCTSALESGRGIGGLADAGEAEAPSGEAPRQARGENPLRLSGLVMAGANHREHAGPDEDDGILTAEEIASLDLSDVEWAVLSACDTGVGDIKVGEGVFGLRRAFQVAGVRTLIMSLWSVDDESTRNWMTALYEARLKKGLSTAESVRHASSKVLAARRKAGESTHPFHWAAFVAAGDWR